MKFVAFAYFSMASRTIIYNMYNFEQNRMEGLPEIGKSVENLEIYPLTCTLVRVFSANIFFTPNSLPVFL